MSEARILQWPSMKCMKRCQEMGGGFIHNLALGIRKKAVFYETLEDLLLQEDKGDHPYTKW